MLNGDKRARARGISWLGGGVGGDLGKGGRDQKEMAV